MQLTNVLNSIKKINWCTIDLLLLGSDVGGIIHNQATNLISKSRNVMHISV